MNTIQRLVGWVKFLGVSLWYAGKIAATGRNYLGCGEVNISSSGRFVCGHSNVIQKGFNIEVSGELKIGDRNYFNRNLSIVCFEKIEIGNDCLIADSVHIYDHDHRTEDPNKLTREQGYSTKPVIVGNNVWLSDRVTILKGVTIGDGAIIGAGAVVAKDIPANAVAVGVPARIVRIRK